MEDRRIAWQKRQQGNNLPASAMPVQKSEKEVQDQALGRVSVEDILGREGPLHVNTLVLATPSRPILAINCGSGEGFVGMVKQSAGVKGIMWNEMEIGLILEDRHTVIRYEPTIHPYAVIFFEKRNKRSDDDDQMRVWEGEFEPVQFTKQNLLKFLNLVEITDAPKEVLEAIKNMKVQERRKQEDTISLDDDSSKMVVEESLQTNIPKRFSLMIPVSDDYLGKFEFEAKVAKKKDSYGREDQHKKVIVLRCLNARQVLRDRMEQVLRMLPQEIPRYYGKMVVSGGNKDEHW